jgi:M6 family metalloprotease-like protein
VAFVLVAGLQYGCLGSAAPQSWGRPAPWTGVAPPTVIEGLPELRPTAPLEFSRAWLGRMEQVRRRRAELASAGGLDGLAPADAAREGAALAGELRVPVIPVLYDGASAPFPVSRLEQRLFAAGAGDTMTYAGYWSEVSGGLLRVTGGVAPWLTLSHRASYYLPAEQFGWSRFGRSAELRREAIEAADAHLDYRQFDNDGPDGVPDSGDDDGFVDFVAIVYGTACPGDGREGGIWPHRAAMAPLETADTSRATGRPLQVTDYVMLPALELDDCGPLQIGVLAHETGHALGLPDLYDYDGSSQGIGAWGLMGTGSHAARFSPAHLDAWSKEQLGWVTVTWIKGSGGLRVPPVASSAQVYRFDEGGSSDRYLLLEYRRRLGSDRFIPGEGLLVWEVDPERGELGAWNTDERRPAVRLVQADAREDLVRGLRADAGDPFPGATDQEQFVSRLGAGFELTSIRSAPAAVTATLRTGGGPSLLLSTGSVRITALANGEPVQQKVEVQRRAGTAIKWSAEASASWLEFQQTASGLLLTADPRSLVPGVYVDTVRLVDSGKLPLAEMIVSFHVAASGYGQIVATELPWSWGLAASNGRILQASYGWDPLGLRPRPRVLELQEGSTHARTLARIPAEALYSPAIDPVTGDVFVVARARGENFLYRVGARGDAVLVASAFGNGPVYGTALHPDGSVLVAEWNGNVHRIDAAGRVTLYTRFPTHVYQIATDRAGNLYAASYGGDVLAMAPDGTSSTLVTGFEPGGLVAIATAPDGSVVAAERGQAGRILRLRRDGTHEILFRSRGAHYYGIATDRVFLYALDLTARQLLRIPLAGQAAVAE